MPQMTGDGMLVAGDAAALCLAAGIWLEGVNFAMASGMYAGEAAVEALARRRRLRRRPRRLRAPARRDVRAAATTASCAGRPELVLSDRVQHLYPQLMANVVERDVPGRQPGAQAGAAADPAASERKRARHPSPRPRPRRARRRGGRSDERSACTATAATMAGDAGVRGRCDRRRRRVPTSTSGPTSSSTARSAPTAAPASASSPARPTCSCRRPTAGSCSTTSSASSAARATWCATARARSSWSLPGGRLRRRVPPVVIAVCWKWVAVRGTAWAGRSRRPTAAALEVGAAPVAEAGRRRHRRDRSVRPAPRPRLREALAVGAGRAVRVDAPSGLASADRRRGAGAGVAGVPSGSCAATPRPTEAAGPVPAFLAAELGAGQALGLVGVRPGANGTLRVVRRLDGGRREVLACAGPDRAVGRGGGGLAATGVAPGRAGRGACHHRGAGGHRRLTPSRPVSHAPIARARGPSRRRAATPATASAGSPVSPARPRPRRARWWRSPRRRRRPASSSTCGPGATWRHRRDPAPRAPRLARHRGHAAGDRAADRLL